MLKVKLAMAIIGISSIHLLKTFIEAGTLGGLLLVQHRVGHRGRTGAQRRRFTGQSCTTLTTAGVMWQTIIHTIFILSALGIAWTDKLMAHAGKPARAH